jgi:multidrug efflux system outer membrane protein
MGLPSGRGFSEIWTQRPSEALGVGALFKEDGVAGALACVALDVHLLDPTYWTDGSEPTKGTRAGIAAGLKTSMRRAFPIVVLAAQALAACGSVPKPDLRLPAAYEAPQAASADPTAEAAMLDRWWLAFDDAQLTALIEQALTANPDAKSAAARLREARASRTRALLDFLPQGDLTGSAERTDKRQLSGTNFGGVIPGFSTSGVSEAYAANFNVSWELDVFGRIFAAGRAARAEVAAARFDYEGTRAALAAQTADAYFQVRGLAIQLADAHETARIQRELLKLADLRADAGLAATSEPDRIAGDLAQAEAEAARLEAELQVQRRILLTLAGRISEPTANIEAPPAVGQAPPVPASLPSTLLARRPDVREAEARLRSALGARDVARLAFLPTFTLTPGVGWLKQKQPGYESETRSLTLGGIASQPLLSVPQLFADLKVRGAQAEQAVAAYEKTVQTAFGEAEASMVRLDADRRRVATLTQGEVRAARAYQAARVGYGRGLTDLQTTLSAEQAWRAVRAQLAAAQVQAVRQTVQAYKALGGGWPSRTDS